MRLRPEGFCGVVKWLAEEALLQGLHEGERLGFAEALVEEFLTVGAQLTTDLADHAAELLDVMDLPGGEAHGT